MSQPTPGRFLVLEGIDGAGKTTQANLLLAALRAEGRRVHVTAEPTESVTGGILREALAGLSPRTPAELAALFTADRIHHNVNPANGIRKLLAEGVDVLCDRYYYSTMAYQGSQTDLDWVDTINRRCPDILHPDLCIFLDLTPDQSLARISRNRVTTEIFEEKSQLERVRNRFHEILERCRDTDRIVVLSADCSPDELAEQILAEVHKLDAGTP
jgi:dTMP kinase